MMNTQEFYVREEQEEEARGPFGRKQLEELIAKGEVKSDTLFYDVDKEAWRKFSEEAELRGLFGNDEMAGVVGRWAGLFFVASGAAVEAPVSGLLRSGDFKRMVQEPFLVLGLALVIYGVICFAWRRRCVCGVRIAAALGLGAGGALLYLSGAVWAAAVFVLGCAGVIAATLLEKRAVVLPVLWASVVCALILFWMRIGY